jgi:hypothetical protein
VLEGCRSQLQVTRTGTPGAIAIVQQWQCRNSRKMRADMILKQGCAKRQWAGRKRAKQLLLG